MIRSRTRVTGAEVALHYDELDAFYRSLWGEHLHHGLWENGRETVEQAVRLLVTRVADRAAITTGSTVCDVGAGYGATARMLALERGARVTAFTLSPVQHERARTASAAVPGVTHVLGDWLAQTVQPGAWDAVVAIESTEHMADKPRFFSQSARALGRGGRLVICAWLADPSTGEWSRKNLLEPICSEGRLPSLGSAADYETWIREAGLELQSFEDMTARVRRTWTISARRMIGRMVTRPSAWAWLMNRRHANRAFAITVLRILIAYRTGCMRYGMFTALKPGGPER